MPRLQSINQNHLPDALPNFRNLGVAIRILLLVSATGMLVALARATSWQDVVPQTLSVFALMQPVLLSSLLLLFVLNSLLTRLEYWQGCATVVIMVMAVTLAIVQLGGSLYVSPFDQWEFGTWRYPVLGAAMSGVLLAYFRLRAQALSPAVYQARLQALQARIRPHFLFNCINSVLGVVRGNPKRAETALEDMADLFRMAMAGTGELVPLRKEVELSRQYLALEQLRLGERLAANWNIDDMPEDALIPPLVLQPLLENAVYHGIEPLAGGGTIEIRLYRSGNEMHLEVRNPQREQEATHAGNKMALLNIRERLALLFDVEARHSVESGKDYYQVHIVMPYVKEETQ
jgi:two-component system, LytTR family, sensor histidine kinase AlgZ